MKSYEIWLFAESKLLKNTPVVLLLVASHRGSSPGKKGFKMALTEKDQLGSIGGGVMEYNTIKYAREILQQEKSHAIKQVQNHNTKAPKDQQSGLTCSGTQTNILVYLSPNNDLDTIKSIIETYKSPDFGYIKIDGGGIRYYGNSNLNLSEDNKLTEGDNWEYLERVGDPFTVSMFGAGHVGYAITRILSTLDFYIKLFDNRDDLPMMDENPYPHEKIVGKYQEIANRVPEGQRSFIVIATYGMEHDAEVLATVIRKNLGYIGLMGSRTKIKKIYNKMRKMGVEEEILERICAPIGIPINDETAEEIAISIVAQLIQYKNSS